MTTGSTGFLRSAGGGTPAAPAKPAKPEPKPKSSKPPKAKTASQEATKAHLYFELYAVFSSLKA